MAALVGDSDMSWLPAALRSSSGMLEGMTLRELRDLAERLRPDLRVRGWGVASAGFLSCADAWGFPVGDPVGEENCQSSSELLALDRDWISDRRGYGRGRGGDDGGSFMSSMGNICPRLGVGVELISSSKDILCFGVLAFGRHSSEASVLSLVVGSTAAEVGPGLECKPGYMTAFSCCLSRTSFCRSVRCCDSS